VCGHLSIKQDCDRCRAEEDNLRSEIAFLRATLVSILEEVERKGGSRGVIAVLARRGLGGKS
jgi:hypothetical protein